MFKGAARDEVEGDERHYSLAAEMQLILFPFAKESTRYLSVLLIYKEGI